jgi:hypothetical protein
MWLRARTPRVPCARPIGGKRTLSSLLVALACFLLNIFASRVRVVQRVCAAAASSNRNDLRNVSLFGGSLPAEAELIERAQGVVFSLDPSSRFTLTTLAASMQEYPSSNGYLQQQVIPLDYTLHQQQPLPFYPYHGKYVLQFAALNAMFGALSIRAKVPRRPKYVPGHVLWASSTILGTYKI